MKIENYSESTNPVVGGHRDFFVRRNFPCSRAFQIFAGEVDSVWLDLKGQALNKWAERAGGKIKGVEAHLCHSEFMNNGIKVVRCLLEPWNRLGATRCNFIDS